MRVATADEPGPENSHISCCGNLDFKWRLISQFMCVEKQDDETARLGDYYQILLDDCQILLDAIRHYQTNYRDIY